MYISFHCFACDAQKRYLAIIGCKGFIVFFKDGCYVGFYHEEGQYPCERERLNMTAYVRAKICAPSFCKQVLIRPGPQALQTSK